MGQEGGRRRARQEGSWEGPDPPLLTLYEAPSQVVSRVENNPWTIARKVRDLTPTTQNEFYPHSEWAHPQRFQRSTALPLSWFCLWTLGDTQLSHAVPWLLIHRNCRWQIGGVSGWICGHCCGNSRKRVLGVWEIRPVLEGGFGHITIIFSCSISEWTLPQRFLPSRGFICWKAWETSWNQWVHLFLMINAQDEPDLHTCVLIICPFFCQLLFIVCTFSWPVYCVFLD